MLCEVIIRYDDGKEDRFLAKEPPEVPEGIKQRSNRMTEFPYTTPSGQRVSNYVRSTKVTSVVFNEVQEPPSPSL
jgi:hypothetical protein